MSLDAFRRAVKENPQDAAEIAQALARPGSDPVITATLTVPNGDELVLVYEGGRWRIDAAAVDHGCRPVDGQRQALLGFLRAFERKRYDVIRPLRARRRERGLRRRVGGGARSRRLRRRARGPERGSEGTRTPVGDKDKGQGQGQEARGARRRAEALQVRLGPAQRPRSLRAAWENAQRASR